jgi:hypothetical protein
MRKLLVSFFIPHCSYIRNEGEVFVNKMFKGRKIDHEKGKTVFLKVSVLCIELKLANFFS